MQRDTPNSLLLGKGNVVAGAKREKIPGARAVFVYRADSYVYACISVDETCSHARVGVREK